MRDMHMQNLICDTLQYAVHFMKASIGLNSQLNVCTLKGIQTFDCQTGHGEGPTHALKGLAQLLIIRVVTSYCKSYICPMTKQADQL